MCNACVPVPQASPGTDAFASRLLDMLNDGALALMVSIGHRTGLFDALAELPPSPASRIAAQAGLAERYVAEWLGAMVVGGVVDYRPAEGLYELPAAHAALLTRAAAPENVAVFAQYIGVLGGVEDRIVDCFRHGGGIGYEHYPRFHDVMAEDSAQTVVAALDSYVLPLVQGLEARLEAGISVLDVGCGRGRALLHLARRFPASRFVGFDLSASAVADARAETERAGLDNLSFATRDLSAFDVSPDNGVFDLVTAFDAIHDQAEPQRVLDGIHRVLAPGGVFLMQDIRASSRLEGNLDHPLGPLLYTISTMHCMTVSLAQGGAGLGTMWGEELALAMLGRAGFTDIVVHRPEHDVQNNFYVMRKT